MQKIKRLVTIHGVIVDSVATTIWDANKGGIKDIVYQTNGVRIEWNLGSTFVPYSNVRYTQDEFVSNANQR